MNSNQRESSDQGNSLLSPYHLKNQLSSDLTNTNQTSDPATKSLLPNNDKYYSDSATELSPTLSSKSAARNKSSNFQVYITTVKLFFGNAYLSIPNTFMFSGVLGGILMFAVVGALNCYTMMQNLWVADRYPKITSYSNLSKRVFGWKGKIVVDISIWLLQISCCISYLYFIGKQLAQIVQSQTDFDYSEKFYILLLTIPAMPLCWIETYTFLSYFSIAGISVALIGMVNIVYYCIHLFATDQAVYTPINYFDWSGMLGHIGVAMFVFEGNAVIMNVRAEAKSPQRYPTILQWAIVSTVTLFTSFAAMCYLTYRDQTSDIFVMSLPLTSYTIFIRLCTCFNAMCSYPIQILAAFDIYEQHSFFKSGKLLKLKKILVRSVIVWLITGISLIIPNFTDFLNIAGAISSGAIAFILPPLLYMHEFRKEIGLGMKIGNWAIIIFGACGAVYSTYFSINEMIKGN